MKNGKSLIAGCLPAVVVSAVQAARMSGMSSNRAGSDRYGSPGTAQAATRTVRITAIDTMRVSPSQASVPPGQTVRFVVHAGGHRTPKSVIGDRAEQRVHEAEMKARPGMSMRHDSSGMTILPGHTRTRIWRLPRYAATLEYACHEPQHFAAAMVGYIHVAAAVPGGAQ